jgi:NADP-dependent 3-hydroxy acid dehydrogenase YdfG
LQEGAQVVLAARSIDKLNKASQEIFKATGVMTHTVVTDASKIADLDALFQKAAQTCGKVDVVFLNTGAASST